MGVPAVAVRGLRRSFGATEVLRGVDLTVDPGEVVVLLGPSGCGKSTLLRLIAGIDRPDGGTVEVAGVPVAGAVDGVAPVFVPPERRGVGLVFQNGVLFGHLDVARNVGYGLERSQRKGGPRVDEMLELVDLVGFGPRAIDTLSGGQQQRVALARALAPAPAVVLFDEPFSNLDAVIRRRLRADVHDVMRRAGVSAVFVTHDREEAFAVGDRVAVMRDGVLVQVGSPEELYRRPVDDDVAAFVGDVSWLPDGTWARPEDLVLIAGDDAHGGEGGGWSGTVVGAEFGGPSWLVEVRLDAVPATDDSSDSSIIQVRTTDDPPPPGARTLVLSRRSGANDTDLRDRTS